MSDKMLDIISELAGRLKHIGYVIQDEHGQKFQPNVLEVKTLSIFTTEKEAIEVAKKLNIPNLTVKEVIFYV